MKDLFYEIIEINTGRFRLDGGAMFGVIPKRLWEKTNPSDAQNRIELSLRCLLIKGPNFCALIDTGMGQKWDSKSLEIYGLENSGWEELLQQKADLRPEDITHVLITHLHFDHAGGLTYFNSETKQIERVFKKALLIVSQENFEHASQAISRERASYRSENWEAYRNSGQIQLISFKEAEKKEILPKLWAFRSDGHSIGQLIYYLSAEVGKRRVFSADLIPTSSHLNQNYGMGFDLQPLILMKEKEKLLKEVALEQSTLVFEHDPFVSSSQVELVKNKMGESSFRLLNPQLNPRLNPLLNPVQS